VDDSLAAPLLRRLHRASENEVTSFLEATYMFEVIDVVFFFSLFCR
jgi:hypothetical protein